MMKNILLKTCLTALALSVAGLANANQVSLGSASEFTVLSASGAVNCTNSIIEGDVGSAVAGTKTGCVQSGEDVTPVSQDIQTDFNTAYSTLAVEQCDNTLTTLAGQVLQPGTYCVDNASTNTGGVLTLDGDASDTWLFKIGASGAGALTGTDFVVNMSGGAEACNVTWWVADAVTLTRGDFKGDILAGKAVTVTGVASNSPVKGRVMANGTVVMTNADVLGCVAEAAARTEEAIAAALAAKLAAEAAEAAALLAVVTNVVDDVIGPNGENVIGAQGEPGIAGARGAAGVNGVNGAQGIQGLAGADSIVAGADGADGTNGTNGTNGEDGVMYDGAFEGDMQYWNGHAWMMITAPTEDAGSLSFCKGVPTWTQGECPYAVGDVGPAGGWVVYTTEGGLHGLEAAPESLGHSYWGCYSLAVGGSFGTSIGDGQNNTANILDDECINAPNLINGTAHGAALAADEYTSNGYDDWFLPSLDELLHTIENLPDEVWKNQGNDQWLTSSQMDAWSVRTVHNWYGEAESHSVGKQHLIRVWPVRVF
jgi:hypothetical protein